MKGSFCTSRAVCDTDLFKSNGSKKSGCAAYIISAVPDSLSIVHTLAGKWLYAVWIYKIHDKIHYVFKFSDFYVVTVTLKVYLTCCKI